MHIEKKQYLCTRKIRKEVSGMNNRHLIYALTIVGMVCSHRLKAQEVGLWYDTELQFDTHGKTNHVNLLYLSADYQASKQIKLSAATISIAKTRDESLIDDLQTFSNVEADNMPLTLALAGVSWTPNQRHTLFAGIRNVNEDYFISPVTSLFTNSSCGIFPTIGCSLDIANYPVASMGVHYAYTTPTFGYQASVYNGQGYDGWTGRGNVWRVTPHSDGLFVMTQADWTQGQGQYFVGGCLHTGTADDPSAKEMLWAYTEQSLTERLSLIADYSHAFGHGCRCTDFAGIGLQYAQGKSTIGIFSDYARFGNDEEWATELIYRHDLSDKVFLQGAYHIVRHGNWQPVGLIRVSVRIDK